MYINIYVYILIYIYIYSGTHIGHMFICIYIHVYIKYPQVDALVRGLSGALHMLSRARRHTLLVTLHAWY